LIKSVKIGTRAEINRLRAHPNTTYRLELVGLTKIQIE